MLRTYQLLLSQLDVAVLVVDYQLRYTVVGGALLADLGIRSEQVEGRHAGDVVGLAPDTTVLVKAFQSALDGLLSRFEYRPNGGFIYETHVRPLRDESGRIVAAMAVTRNITEQRSRESGLRRVSTIDPLTQLATRTALTSFVEDLTVRERPASLICLDLDAFKAVNDTYGHGVGDQVLRETGRRILGLVRNGDVAARMGGDEFVIVLPGAPLAAANDAADRLRTAITAPIELVGLTVRVGCSCGVVERVESESAESWLHRGDLAMYAFKTQPVNLEK